MTRFIRVLILAFLAAFEVALALLIIAPKTSSHPQAHLRAFSEWARHPSPETKARLDDETSRLRRGRAAMELGLLSALALNTAFMIRVVIGPGRDRSQGGRDTMDRGD